MDRIIINVSPMEYSRLKYTLANEFEPITPLKVVTLFPPIEIKCQEEPNIFNSPEESFSENVKNL